MTVLWTWVYKYLFEAWLSIHISGIARLYGKFSSVQLLSHATCLWSHGLKHSRLPCPSPTSGPYSNLCPLSRWCHPTISSSVPFSSCLQSFPASESCPMSPLFASGGQSYWSFSFSISPSNEHPGLISFRMDWLDLLAVQGTLKGLLQHYSSKASIRCLPFFIVQLSHPYMTTGKTIILTRRFMILYRRQESRSPPRKRNAKKQNGCLRRPYK